MQRAWLCGPVCQWEARGAPHVRRRQQALLLGDLPLAGDIGMDVMSAKQISEARRIFDKLDKDKDEKLNRDELALAYRHFGRNPTNAEFNKMATEVRLAPAHPEPPVARRAHAAHCEPVHAPTCRLSISLLLCRAACYCQPRRVRRQDGHQEGEEEAGERRVGCATL